MAKFFYRPADIRAVLSDAREDLFTVRGAILIASWLAMLASVVFALLIGRDMRRAEQYALNEIDLSPPGVATPRQGNTSAQQYQAITARDLFKAQTATQAQAPNVAASSQLKMRLVGTTIGPTGPIAIMEDLNKNEQDVFILNENAFGRAKLVAIESESVKVEFNNRQETLLIEDGETKGGRSASSDDQNEFAIAESDLNDALSNLPLLLSQARAVPYFRNGQSIGMRLFAIRSGSMYEKLGLKNGDILLAVNQHNLSDPSQALKIFEQLRSERSIDVKLERNGQPKDLSYSIR